MLGIALVVAEDMRGGLCKLGTSYRMGDHNEVVDVEGRWGDVIYWLNQAAWPKLWFNSELVCR